jgi:hypothetical protein
VTCDDTSKKTKDEIDSRSPLSTLKNTYKQQKEGDGNQVLLTSESTKFVPLVAESDQVSDIQQSKDDAATAGMTTLATSSLPSPPLKREPLEHESEPPKDQNDSQVLHTHQLTIPVILSPASDQTKNADHPKLPVALERIPSRSGPPNNILKQHPGFNFSHLIANHAQSNLEVAAIEYFRAKRGNPPQPVVPKPRVPVPISDYELPQWVGTHPDFPLVKQPNIAELLATPFEVPQKTLPKSKSAIDLFNAGIVELPAELPQRSKSTVNLHNPTSTDDSKSNPVEAIFAVNSKNELDTIFADVDRDILTGTTESTTVRESDTAPITVLPQPKDEGVLIDIVTDEHDDPILKALIEMGYPRIVALSALERYDYDLERVCLKVQTPISD